ncbi:unnamed protein product [Heligmosomoides polygyrus]|uniref:Uncharacterized protein n=1 Tax=Heligmosomoides polygyrus TaxID=6339 RepID=A0A183FSF6_HELPZ|nr:unnamed protein product [Heligmosomoides polygyrus]
MTTTEPTGKTSPFLSIFHRKKRVNGAKSSDDLKAANGQRNEQVTESQLSNTVLLQATDSAAEKKRSTKKHDSSTLPAKLDTKKKKHKTVWEQTKVREKPSKTRIFYQM